MPAPIDPREVVHIFYSRQRAQGGHIARMHEIKKMYDGDIVIPLPELDEQERPSVANLIKQGIDELGMRASSVLPDVTFPSAHPGDDFADNQARLMRQAVQGWDDMNGRTKKEGRRCRYLVAYGSGPTMVKPVGGGAYQGRPMPYWHILDPLCVYPAPTSDKDDIEPANVVVQRHVTLGWLRQRYPIQAARIYKGPTDRSGTHKDDMPFDLLEYNDEWQTSLVVAGKPRERFSYADINDGASGAEQLEWAENRAGMCLAVVPGRITLGRLQGHFDELIGMFMAQARMTAYEQIAVFKGIFPSLWVVTHPGSPSAAHIVRPADGKQGIIGEIENGTIMPINPQSGPAATNAIDRLERNARVAGRIPSDWGGESAPDIRTGKRGAQISASTTDSTLAELQNVLAEAVAAEYARAIAVEKGWYGNKQVSFYLTRKGRNQGDTFVPNKLFTTDFCWVKFSMPGVDAAGIPIELGQRTQTGQMSQDTARHMDPMIEDPEHERDMVELEGLRTALLKGLEQQGATGALDPQEVALIAQYKRENKGLTLEECILKAHQDIQKQQADAQNQAATAPPGGPAVPGQQPGLGQSPPGGVPPTASGAPQLSQIMGMLRQPTQQVPAEAPAAAAS